MLYTERTRLRGLIRSFVEGKNVVPPVGLRMLDCMAKEFLEIHEVEAELKNWIMVEIHNSVWMPIIASIPYERRLLLLPQCLRHSKACSGEIDELGLLCHKCGKCTIPSMEDRADELGVMSMVAEGFTTVIQLIENQVIDAVIGISCLDSLEKAFPMLVNHAVPGVAVVLNKNGCVDTTVDVAYVNELMQASSDKEISLLNFDQTRHEVQRWFELGDITTDTPTKTLAREWMKSNGKRWRPFLLTAVYQALKGTSEIPEEVKRAAMAVEYFHKASLVHDDVQDKDKERYGAPTMNALHGDAIAINIGDMLLGEGYRILSKCEHKELLGLVAEAHVRLCEGQGKELMWTKNPAPLTVDSVLEIFRAKTVPAFGVALKMGLVCADCVDPELVNTLEDYAEAIGIAYQLADDLDDYAENSSMCKPTIVKALHDEHKDWSKDEIVAEVKRLKDEYLGQAMDVTELVTVMELKRLLMLINGRL